MPETPDGVDSGTIAMLTAALGAVVVNFAGLEESLHDAIHVMVGTQNNATYVLTTGLSFRNLVGRFGALCSELDSVTADPEHVRIFCKHLNKLNEDRNLYIHSTWNAYRAGVPSRYRRTAKIGAGLQYNAAAVSIGSITKLANDLRNAEHKLWEYVP